MITMTPAPKSDVTRLYCPECKEKVRGMGLIKDSIVTGLSITCRNCKRMWLVKTE